jgi:Domain of unknown function (DUF4412)
MKKPLPILTSIIVALTLITVRAQPRPPTGPNFDGAMDKLFGDNSGFSATMEMHSTDPAGKEMTMSAKMAHVEGKSRIEMDMGGIQGANMPPQAVAQMKRMGMSKTTVINRSDKNVSYMIYPDMRAYTEISAQSKSAPMSDYKVDVTKLGEESIDGHDCIKNKCVVTDPNGPTHESTVWNASDLKQFPLKIETKSENGQIMVILFKDVKLEKPDDAQFEAPSDFKKYDSMMSLMMSLGRGGAPQ